MCLLSPLSNKISYHLGGRLSLGELSFGAIHSEHLLQATLCTNFFIMFSSLFVRAVALALLCGLALAQVQPEQIKCRGYKPTDVSYPTPYISPADRSARCKALFSRYNSTGTANLSFVGQNTYHNPCKIECGLCVETELPEEKEEDNVKRFYPPHISLKDSIVKCTDEVEVYEQFMPDGIRCGPWHMCENFCCVAKPDLFPNSKRLRQQLKDSADGDVNTFSQTIPPEWTKPLTCEEEGFFQNPNDCHKFYRCYKAGSRGGFSRTLFDCKPKNLVFDPQLKVCVPVDEEGLGDVCGLLNAEGLADY